MAHSKTYHEILRSFERFTCIPPVIRRLIAAVIVIPTLCGMFFASGILLSIPLGIVYAGCNGTLSTHWTIAGVFASLLVIAAMLVMTIFGAIGFCQSRELEDIAFALGFAFWSCAGILFLCLALTHEGRPLP